jgi:hypothetical protein
MVGMQVEDIQTVTAGIDPFDKSVHDGMVEAV